MNKDELKQLKRQLPKLPGEKTYTYHYACMECAIAHQGASAPAYIAFFTGIPFVVLIAVCLIIIKVFKEKK